MRELLLLAHRIPFPPNKGDKIRSFHILRHLARTFRIRLGCFADEAEDSRHAASLRKYCEEVFCLPLSRNRIATSAFRALMTGRSLSESYFRDSHMQNWVAQTIRRRDIRNVFVYCSTMAPYVYGQGGGRRVVVDMVDVDSRKWGAYAASGSHWLRPLFRLEQRRVLELEKNAGAAGDRILFVSRAEAESFALLEPDLAERINTVNNGVDCGYFDPASSFENPYRSGSLPIVFTGAMDYRANADAAAWFARASFPAVRSAHPRAEFWIVGANPSSGVRRLVREPGVRVTGRVPDVRPYLAHAACAVAPLRVARGIQNKVLEAMAMAKSVVANPAALEGLAVQPGLDVLAARDGCEFIQRVCEVLAGQRECGRAARRHVLCHHQWQETLKVLDEIFADNGSVVKSSIGLTSAMLPVETA